MSSVVQPLSPFFSIELCLALAHSYSLHPVSPSPVHVHCGQAPVGILNLSSLSLCWFGLLFPIMSAYANHCTLPLLRAPSRCPGSAASSAPSVPVSPPCSHQGLEPLEPVYALQEQNRTSALPQPHMDPLDLLSRVALGQIPMSCAESTTRERRTYSHNIPTKEACLPKRAPLEPCPSVAVNDVRFRRAVEYSQPPPSVFGQSRTEFRFAPQARPLQDRFVSDFSPVSSDDGLTNARQTRPSTELHGRVAKVLRTAKDSSIHKPRSQPSRFCHICSRTSKKVGLVACGNFTTGACRKVVCQKCFIDHDWNWKLAFDMGASWICTHCREECPDRAQCAIYRRTNERRREQQQQQKSQKGEQRSDLDRSTVCSGEEAEQNVNFSNHMHNCEDL